MPQRSRNKQTLADIGEDRLVTLLTRGLPVGPGVRTGAGDDCAVVGTAKAGKWQLLKTDAVIEGIHFLAKENPRRVGHKALCRAISDIAAMGGVPENALITVAAAPGLQVDWLRGFYDGLAAAARQFSVGIVGGETSRSPGPLFVSIAMTGWVEPKCCVLRSGGRPGHYVYVTGELGGSIRGKHLDFVPRIGEARWLATRYRPSAMMDLSDGLGADLPRMAAASGCGYQLEDSRIPLSKGANLEAAMRDGEDYELLFTMPRAKAHRMEREWAEAFPGLRLSRIGELIEAKGRATKRTGFDHFGSGK